MHGWLARAVLVFVTILATACASGVVLGAASAETRVAELMVTCLACGEQWLFAPSATLGAGLLSLFRRRKPADTCPKCGSRAVRSGTRMRPGSGRHGRTA